jgi:hypothetical protein
MSRRGKKIGPISLVAMLAAIGLISKFLEGLPKGSGTVAVRALYGAGALIVVYLIARFFARRICAARTLRVLVRKAHSATQQHLMPLVRRRAQLVQLDAYGKPKMENWVKEVSLLYF